MDRKPLWLLAELTYKCPLQCPYCSNPLDFAGPRFKRELSTDEWCRVFREAKALGVLQLGLSGGEPTLRPDLEELVRTAHGLGLYTSLITSAYRLSQERLAAMLGHYQWVDPDGLQYFKNRLQQAPRDAEYALGLVTERFSSPADQDRAVAALEFKCDVLWCLLDAVERGPLPGSGR